MYNYFLCAHLSTHIFISVMVYTTLIDTYVLYHLYTSLYLLTDSISLSQLNIGILVYLITCATYEKQKQTLDYTHKCFLPKKWLQILGHICRDILHSSHNKMANTHYPSI